MPAKVDLCLLKEGYNGKHLCKDWCLFSMWFFIMLYLGLTLGANIGITQKTCLKQVSSSYSIMRAGPPYSGQFTVW